MSLMDLSKFKKNFVRDTAEEIEEINKIKFTSFIPEGTHEVTIVGIHEKDGRKFKLEDKLGGALSFSLVVKNVKKQEQLI